MVSKGKTCRASGTAAGAAMGAALKKAGKSWHKFTIMAEFIGSTERLSGVMMDSRAMSVICR
jgi:hypothetical protein